MKGFTDKSETERLAAQLEDETRQIRLGLKSPHESLLATTEQRRLSDLLVDYRSHLKSRDLTPKQVDQSISRLQRIFAAMALQFPIDITASHVERFLNELREQGRSKQTANHFLKAIKQFCSWMVQSKCLRQSPVAHLQRLNVAR